MLRVVRGKWLQPSVYRELVLDSANFLPIVPRSCATPVADVRRSEDRGSHLSPTSPRLRLERKSGLAYRAAPSCQETGNYFACPPNLRRGRAATGRTRSPMRREHY
jgi:hypothetical protein